MTYGDPQVSFEEFCVLMSEQDPDLLRSYGLMTGIPY